MPNLTEFRPINLPRDAQTCLDFERDMAACNGGNAGRDAGRDAMVLREIAARSNNDPPSDWHVWRDDEIVGQLSLGRVAGEPMGYVHFFYVAPAQRGTGLAAQLDEYAMEQFAARGFVAARLSVMTSNARAHNFYRRQNWRDGADRADKPGAIWMDKSISR